MNDFSFGDLPNFFSTTLREHNVQKFSTLKLDVIIFFLFYIHDYFDKFLTLECNLDHIAEDLCDTIKG